MIPNRYQVYMYRVLVIYLYDINSTLLGAVTFELLDQRLQDPGIAGHLDRLTGDSAIDTR